VVFPSVMIFVVSVVVSVVLSAAIVDFSHPKKSNGKVYISRLKIDVFRA
jgi:hypothetical protein